MVKLPLPSVTCGPAVLKRGEALLLIYNVTVTPGSFVETLANAREPLATTAEKSGICAVRFPPCPGCVGDGCGEGLPSPDGVDLSTGVLCTGGWLDWLLPLPPP